MLPPVLPGDLGSINSKDLPLTPTCNFDYMPSLQDLIGDRIDRVEYNNSNNIQGVMRFMGGEDAAIERLNEWMWRDDNLKDYFDIRNGMLGERYSSKLSPWLALGCISPR
jgi:deoxyribodipyrimidine photo-lyase